MPKQLRLQFDPDQKHQLDAVGSVVRLFEGLPHQAGAFALGQEVVPNLPIFESLSESWLAENLRVVQQQNDLPTDLLAELDVDEGLELEGISNASWRCPSFTVEMETGTGKTYAYVRTIYELRKQYGFSKFIIVVPSIAIYEGVIKNFQITRDHFSALYGNERVNVIEYEGSKLSQLRAFAASTFVEVLVITLDSFNKASNVIYKPSEKLPGERLPYQYLQAVRPILILDEPQNMGSEKAKAALRTLHPLFTLRYSATHRETPNLVYRLTPFDAYRLNLVKKIQVFGVTERENVNQPFLGLVQINRGSSITAQVRTYVEQGGKVSEEVVTLKHGEDLYEKTHRAEHRGGYRVSEINAADDFVEFENGLRLSLTETLGPNRPEVFRAQIRQTIEQHIAMQERLRKRGIKVLSLFFIDRVANYVAPSGIIRRIFDEEFERLKHRSELFEPLRPEEVRNAYFAVYRDQPIDTQEDNEERQPKEEREAEKAAFELIMKDKERLLSFDEKVCFIFAHSALKEGWDNPNVFQICTLRQTVSEMRKRQEIGRGLRLPVNQDGARVFDEDANVLSVIANESYQSYASRLQAEYVEAGQAAPPKPSQAGRSAAKRQEAIFGLQAFRDFWAKLQRRATYQINLDTEALIQECAERLNNLRTPQAVIVIEKGEFVVTEYTFTLLSVGEETCKIQIFQKDTLGNTSQADYTYKLREDLSKSRHDERLRGYRITQIVSEGDVSRVVFGNGQELLLHSTLRFQSEQGQRPRQTAAIAPQETYPVPNFIERAARQTGLTRATVRRIFDSLTEARRTSLFANPEGFTAQFVTEIANALADHVADRIEFVISPDPTQWDYLLEDLFPPEKSYPQKELIPASAAGLYDHMQVDSEVEANFVNLRLNADGEVIFYFKFPPLFRIPMPRVIGNYNPDWGVARYGPDRKLTLELVRETKGSTEMDNLRFPHERRKIECARRCFAALGIDYRVVTDQTPDWWHPETEWQLPLKD